MPNDQGERTLLEIIERCREGQMPTQEEGYLAILALTSAIYFAHNSLKSVADDPKWANFEYRERQSTYAAMLGVSPRHYLGDNVPGNPGYDYVQDVANKLYDKFFGDDK